MRNHRLLKTQNGVDAKITHLLYKLCAFFSINSNVKIAHRAAVTLPLTIELDLDVEFQYRKTPNLRIETCDYGAFRGAPRN